jgi:flagellar hook-associated protein 2
MGRIQSNIGLVSGVDIASTVDQLISISAQPRDRLQNRLKGLEAQQVAINELTALVIGVQLQTTRLGNASSLNSIQVNSSRSDILRATANGTPALGSYSIQTIRTAQASSATSAAFTSSGDALETGQLVVRTGGFVDSNAKLEDLRGGAGVSNGRIRIIDRGGVTSEIDLRFASTIDDVVKAINSSSNLRISAKISGDRIVLTDLTGQTNGNLRVQEVGDGRTAADLGLSEINVASNSASGEDLALLTNASRLSGLRDQGGVSFRAGTDLSVVLSDGSTVNVDANQSTKPTTIGQLLTRINAANADKLEARIASNGKSIELVDKTSGGGSFTANGRLADQLGLSNISAVSGTLTGARIASAISSPLLSSLNGGAGIGEPGSISITNRSGTTTVVDLSGAESLKDVIDTINASGAGVTASFNRSKTGIAIQDVTGSTASNLIIANSDSNNTATKLQIASNVSANSIDSGSLQLRYVSEATELGKLNQGRGIQEGSIDIVNSLGQKRSIDISKLTDKTVDGVIQAIEGTGIGISARVNDAGDGIVVTDTTNGSGSFTISDRVGSSTARDLGIVGSGQSKIVEGNSVLQIEGSGTFRLDVGDTPTVQSLVQSINQSNGPLTASLLVAGSTTRILFNSRTSGEAGRIVVDGSDIGIETTTTSIGRDAVIAINPTEDTGGILVRSSTNTLDNAIEGLTLNIGAADDTPVEIRVEKDAADIEKNLQLFADQFNKVRDRLDAVASFDPSTGQTGILFGANEVLRIEQNLNRMINQTIFGAGSIRGMEQLGLSLDSTGKLRFDSGKLSQALDRDSEAVVDFFTKENSGFAAKSKSLLESLVGIDGGLLVSRNEAIQRRIEDGSRRVEFLNAKLDRERERLLLQFFRMEETIARIRNSASGLSSLQALAGEAAV